MPRRLIANTNRKAYEALIDTKLESIMKVPRGTAALVFALSDASGAGESIVASLCNRQKVHARERFVIVT